jgi:hypothetical protein
MIDVLKAQKRRPAMKKTSTVRVNGSMIFKGHKLTIGLDLGDRWSNYCVLDEAGEVLLEQKLATTPEAMKQISSLLLSGRRRKKPTMGTLCAFLWGCLFGAAAHQVSDNNSPL